ncbi:MAG: CPBP family intramembrane glutamic endopeptidase [Thermoprotei archaeon]
MMRKNISHMLLFTFPLIVWPLVFVILRNTFLYSMGLATTFLGLTTVIFFKNDLMRLLINVQDQKSKLESIFIGVVSSFVLYIIFLLGGKISYYLGFENLVLSIYGMVLNTNKIILSIALIIIGIMEEIYWRGFIQGIFINNVQYPWILSSIYYSMVHIATFNYILVIAALIVGLVTGYVAYQFGIIPSMITHIIWLELVIVIFPILL